MILDEAQDAIRAGAFFGAVAPLLDMADRAELAEWFVRTAGVPNLDARPAMRKPTEAAAPGAVHAAPVLTPTGDLCKRCGGFMVRTGSCMTCQACGDSSGGCG